MNKTVQIHIDLAHINDPEKIRVQLLENGHGPFDHFEIIRRSVDARSKRPRFTLQVSLKFDTDPSGEPLFQGWRPVDGDLSAIVVGSGPAGLFAALALIEHNVRPIVLERGRPASRRRKDIARLLRSGEVDPVSNYCFGEGGAGAFSDGKLYTRATKRGNVGEILDAFIFHGARKNIRVDSRPHIGSNLLPGIVERMRQTILHCGGQFFFETQVSDFLIENDRILGIAAVDGRIFNANAVILATGHSARDIYELYKKKSLEVLPKSLAVGVRVEHPQPLIDAMQYHSPKRHPNLPPAEYRFVSNIESRGVYSFCMCPGGHIIPAATTPGELVVNGMSNAARNSPFANSGIVVEVQWEDIKSYHSHGAFAFLSFQKDLERRAFDMAGGEGQRAPAQRLTDFISGRVSSILPKTSYLPGVASASMADLFPQDIARRLQSGLEAFGRKRKGFVTDDALLIAVESRTSAPLTLPRDNQTLMHPHVQGLYPCGEGAGYAGGIVSSALDGRRVGIMAARFLRE